ALGLERDDRHVPARGPGGELGLRLLAEEDDVVREPGLALRVVPVADEEEPPGRLQAGGGSDEPPVEPGFGQVAEVADGDLAALDRPRLPDLREPWPQPVADHLDLARA